MLTFQDAERVAQSVLEKESRLAGTKLQIVRELTIAKDYGWIFRYQSAAYIRTRDFYDILLGNAPFLVQKSDGRVVVFGTAYPLEWYIAQYESEKEAAAQH